VQREVDAHKRLVLVDWLVEVVDEFKLAQGTLFLAVNLVDRYLSRRPVPRAALQLLGVTALWLASKFEVRGPCLGRLVHRRRKGRVGHWRGPVSDVSFGA
jgi:hypothetical protein